LTILTLLAIMTTKVVNKMTVWVGVGRVLVVVEVVTPVDITAIGVSPPDGESWDSLEGLVG